MSYSGSDEVEGVLKRLKTGNSAGHDMLQSELLKYGGLPSKYAIIDMEHVPLLNSALLSPYTREVAKIPWILTADPASGIPAL